MFQNTIRKIVSSICVICALWQKYLHQIIGLSLILGAKYFCQKLGNVQDARLKLRVDPTNFIAAQIVENVIQNLSIIRCKVWKHGIEITVCLKERLDLRRYIIRNLFQEGWG